MFRAKIWQIQVYLTGVSLSHGHNQLYAQSSNREVSINISAQPLHCENNSHELNQYCNYLNKEINILEIENVTKNLWNGKSAGIDGVGAEFYKHTSTDILPILHKLFNIRLITGVSLSHGHNQLYAQSPNREVRINPVNYRGISITTTMYKIFSSIINNRLYHWTVEHHKIDEAQSSF